MGKNQPEGITYPDTDVLVYADFITLGYFFFSKYSLKSNYQELVSELKKKENYTEEKIKDFQKTLYLIFDYPYKYYTFKLFEV